MGDLATQRAMTMAFRRQDPHARRDSYLSRRGRRIWPWLLGVVALVAAAVGAGMWASATPLLSVAGIDEGQVVPRQDADAVRIEITARRASAVHVLLDGEAIDTTQTQGRHVIELGPLAAGEHVVEITADGRLGWKDVSLTRRFLVDLDAPTLLLPERIGIIEPGVPLVLKGAVDDAVSVFINDAPLEVDRGKFSVLVQGAPGIMTIKAVGANGSIEERTVEITDQNVVPNHPPMRAVHITAEAWADPVKREAVLVLGRLGLIDTVQLDIKDERGVIGYDSAVPLARQIGAVSALYDATAALTELHDLGLGVVGRIVNFRDPILGPWARDNGRPDMLVLDGSGTQPYESEYGEDAYTNFANPDVQQYNIDLAVEAAGLGFDEILYDYVRRPDGPFDSMSFPGIEVRSEVAVAEFVRRTREALANTDVQFGVSVFGIAATRPNEIAQDVPLLLPSVDFISPMLYPSLWNPGEYGVDDPAGQPYDIISRSMTDFLDLAKASGVAVIPWLQAYSPREDRIYGPAEVDAQIRAAADAGGHGFLLWNSSSIYDLYGLIGSAPGN